MRISVVETFHFAHPEQARYFIFQHTLARYSQPYDVCTSASDALPTPIDSTAPAPVPSPCQVRTPLNGCLASAEMLLETPLEDEQRELAKTICVSGSILLSTVSNFLDFFKLEAGKVGGGRVGRKQNFRLGLRLTVYLEHTFLHASPP